jgi:predicted acetyltransferase
MPENSFIVLLSFFLSHEYQKKALKNDVAKKIWCSSKENDKGNM